MRLEEITETEMENGGVANGIEKANGTAAVKADKESETEKLIEPDAEVECFKKDFFEGIKSTSYHIYDVHYSLNTVN